MRFQDSISWLGRCVPFFNSFKMQAVGRIGSYISKSVYTVSGPFHPFGGAVDIIVVEQPDGSYKSSPWYVRFGKFQGVLKSREKVVSISVNDVDADFHMHLDHKGEAFFLREVEVEEIECMSSPPSSSSEDMEGQCRNRLPLKAKSCNYDSDWPESVKNERNAVTRANSRRSQILGFVFGRRSSSEEEVQEKEDAPGVGRMESLELAEFTADLLDLKWSTNLDSPRAKKEKASLLPVADTSKNGVIEEFPVGGSSHDDDTDHVSKDFETKCVTSEYIVKTTTSVETVREDTGLSNSDSVMTDASKSDYHVSSVSIVSEVVKSDSEIQNSIDQLNGLSEIQECLSKEDQFRFIHEEKMSFGGGPMGGASESFVTECFSQLVCLHQSNDPLKDIGPQSIPAASGLSISTCSSLDEQNVLGLKQKHESSTEPVLDPQSCDSIPPCIQASRIEEELDSTNAKHREFSHSDHVDKETEGVYCSGYSLDQSVIDDYLNDANLQPRRLCSVSSDACISETGQAHNGKLTRMAKSLPVIEPLSNNLEASDLGCSTNPSTSPGMNSGTCKDHQSPGARITRESEEESANPTIGSPTSTDSLEGSRRNWAFPFKRSRGRKVPDVDMNGCESSNGGEILDNSSDLERGPDVPKVKVTKKNVRTITPTSEQLASLNLKQGKNIVVFTFSTSMLGKQQVDARIFLWRWDTKIVISDVDGTITRSDLLGQVMPLVGMDWSQTGVAHLFSAIKENGYQLLFLSARSISQSFITRQFLFNIKQDGKALPDGPVVISPDGLFPSLFREVVRRAPHEFKIACLEDIKALFPPDRNPFYAGFGNRDTDEVSYLKVGIPIGKIFIINPKGEIAVNRRVDTKSYLALHALVHGMFPIISTCEEEDFNSWNYWKMPPPLIEP